MSNLADLIEQYLQKLFLQSNSVELQRRELARMFRCVPSQINYVLETRFSTQKGYLVESRRGGGGYIRIYRVQPSAKGLREIAVPDQISEENTERLLEDLLNDGLIDANQFLLARFSIRKALLEVPHDLEMYVRARLLKAVLLFVEEKNRSG